MVVRSMARRRFPRSRQHVRAQVLGPRNVRSLITLSFLAVVVVLTTVQFTALTGLSISEEEKSKNKSSKHEGFAPASPIEQVLREQRDQHQEHAKQRQQRERDRGVDYEVVGEEESKQAQKDPQSYDRRLLNTTHGKNPELGRIIGTVNRPSNAVVVPVQVPVHTQQGQAHQDPSHRDPDPNYVNASVKAGSPQARQGNTNVAALNYETTQNTPSRKNLAETKTSTTRTNPTTLTRTTTATQKKKNPAPPWKFKRSIPRPPSDFESDTTPLDPLRPAFNLTALTPLNYTLRSKYHGLLLDGGRHYFQIDWIKRMIDILAVLQYNLIQFRLTDDQVFNVKLKSQPDLAYPAQRHGNNKTYTPEELRDLVAYAKSRKIVMIPEINVPGHAGGWAGIPGLIVQCPIFICEKGYGVPMNVTHPKLRPVLTDVLREVIDIFDNPPFLHLGGDEVNMAKPCFDEIGEKLSDYSKFEQMLKMILLDIEYPEEQVVRWEMTGQSSLRRAGKITQFWFDVPGERKESAGPFFASGGLYFDFNEMDMAWKVFLNTRRYYHLNKGYHPLGIIAGTFELDSQFWYDRNVVGRLLAVTMGASVEVEVRNGAELYSQYMKVCRQVGFTDALCRYYGLPFVEWKTFQDEWLGLRKEWIAGICERLTRVEIERKYLQPDKRRSSQTSDPRSIGANCFWKDFGSPFNGTAIEVRREKVFEQSENAEDLAPLQSRLVNHTGITMDLSLDDQPPKVTGPIIRIVHSLGFNLIKLRLVDDFSFAYQSSVQPTASYPVSTRILVRQTIPVLSQTLVADAAQFGIGIIPEISISTNSGGWYRLGLNVECPRYTCEKGTGILDVNDPYLVPTTYSIIREVLDIATSGMIHLGGDEREESMACFAEAGKEPDFDHFEKKLSHLLSFDGISSDRIMRWGNQEQIAYPGRIGSITHCRHGDCRADDTVSWFATVDLRQGGPWDIYNSARELALQRPIGIFAEMGRMDTQSFEKHQTPKRLLAFAMGTSDMQEWSRGMFEEAYVRMCEAAFGKTRGCEEFASSDEGVLDDANRLDVHREAICAERTKVTTKYIFRDEYKEGN